MELRTQVRAIHPHDADTALGDYHEMVLVGRRNGFNDYTEHERRDAIGRKVRGNASGYRWHVAVCNNPDCGAEMVVQLDQIIKDLATKVGLDVPNPQRDDAQTSRQARSAE